LRCDDFPGLIAMLRAYLAAARGTAEASPRRAALAIAAPADDPVIKFVNRPWNVAAAAVEAALGLDRLERINDFTAVALSIPRLQAADLVRLGGDAPKPRAPIAVLGPGTGLGVSGLLPVGERWVPLSGEGGHATLAAAGPRELAAIARLRERFGHVSAERALSGPGLVNLHRALAEIDGVGVEALATERITAQALDGGDPLCRETLDMFCALLGVVAGNLALTLGATGGVYIAGGIVPKLGDFLHRSAFRARFQAKGRMSYYVEAIPCFVVTHPRPALIGLAAMLAER
jgi:glucokinase